MPSIIASLSVVLLALSSISSAAPTNPRPTPTQNYALPTTGSGTELPAVPSGMSLKFAVIGRGVQNYSCPDASSTPTAMGAVAKLWDIKPLLQSSQSTCDAFTQAASYVFLPSDSPIIHAYSGRHYFDSNGVPTFEFNKNNILKAAKSAAVPAPADASKGPAGTGAVPWLYLTAKPGAGSVGLQAVYRVETSGGVAPSSCSGQPKVVSIDYAAQYWFYG